MFCTVMWTWPAVLILVICRATSSSSSKPTTSSTYSNIGLNDKLFSENIVLQTSAGSAILCVGQCVRQGSCLTITYHQGVCRGHPILMTSSASWTFASGAKTFARRNTDVLPTPVPDDGAARCNKTGLHQLVLSSGLTVTVYCEEEWLVILKRTDGSVNFTRNWTDYETGFGNVSGEHWLGLEIIRQITWYEPQDLQVDVEDTADKKGIAMYANFSLGTSASGYTLHFNNFLSGNAGDSLTHYHKGLPFGTPFSESGWAEIKQGGWWYGDDTGPIQSSLCGVYHRTDGVVWLTFGRQSLKAAQMKIKPLSAP